MTGTAADWALGAALATVAAIGGRRLAAWLYGGFGTGRPHPRSQPRPPTSQAIDALVHLAMVLGMAAMLVPRADAAPRPFLSLGFGALAAGLAVPPVALRAVRRGSPAVHAGTAHARHRIHHAAMAGVMALMAAPTRGGATRAVMPGMGPGVTAAMSQTAAGPSPVLLAAFGYTCVLALVFAWRLPVAAGPAPGPGAQERIVDPVGHACEVIMLVSTAVMLLPMV